VTTSSGASSAGLLRRDREAGWLGGVAAGIARRYGVDVSLVRLAFVVATAAGGAGIAAYALGWLLIPTGDSGPSRVRIKTGRAAVEVALGTGLLLVAVLLTFRALGIWLSDAIVWPLVLIVSGGALIWRQSMGGTAERPPGERRPQGAGGSHGAGAGRPGTAGAPAASRLPGPGATGAGVAAPMPGPGAGASTPAEVAVAEGRRTVAAISRTGLGIALVVAAGFVFLQTTGALGAARDVLLALLVAVVVLGVILAPWIARLVRSLTQERAERIRSQERAEVAAHLHDSVLQTLAMVQRRAGDPGEVAALARRQERELRAWLADRPAPGQAARLAAALEAAAAEVEESHGVPVEVVVVGDRELDPRHEAIVAAAREAMTNAAKFGEGSPVDVYAESSESRTQVFVRDRGPGFNTAAVPPDRRGVRESIVGRMRRHGGRGRITSSPGAGTEVELVLEERQ
jgi:signal transduction histidine kinase/phage shock protein PspC (stress-responsive transcriptional regulator)